MAIDSREKRATACALHFMVWFPLADGTVGQPDRQQCQAVYPGITANGIIAVNEGFFRRPWCRRLSGPFGRREIFG